MQQSSARCTAHESRVALQVACLRMWPGSDKPRLAIWTTNSRKNWACPPCESIPKTAQGPGLAMMSSPGDDVQPCWFQPLARLGLSSERSNLKMMLQVLDVSALLNLLKDHQAGACCCNSTSHPAGLTIVHPSSTAWIKVGYSS